MINSSQLLFLANALGACSLDGIPAVLELAHNGALVRVRDKATARSACFNWSVATKVIKKQGGRFTTRQACTELTSNALQLLALA